MSRAQIAELGRLKAGWDGYDAPIIASQTITHADMLYAALSSWGHEVKITPMSNGGVSLEWKYLGRDYTLEVGETEICGIVEGR